MFRSLKQSLRSWLIRLIADGVEEGMKRRDLAIDKKLCDLRGGGGQYAEGLRQELHEGRLHGHENSARNANNGGHVVIMSGGGTARYGGGGGTNVA